MPALKDTPTPCIDQSIAFQSVSSPLVEPTWRQPPWRVPESAPAEQPCEPWAALTSPPTASPWRPTPATPISPAVIPALAGPRRARRRTAPTRLTSGRSGAAGADAPIAGGELLAGRGDLPGVAVELGPRPLGDGGDQRGGRRRRGGRGGDGSRGRDRLGPGGAGEDGHRVRLGRRGRDDRRLGASGRGGLRDLGQLGPAADAEAGPVAEHPPAARALPLRLHGAILLPAGRGPQRRRPGISSRGSRRRTTSRCSPAPSPPRRRCSGGRGRSAGAPGSPARAG